ncbi:NAD-dependent epimerase/dehydratase family protein [Flavobacterium sp.]|uniref:NAD-dependent epimerase/dehydratase family protein n=1 Tax=Flavobacterium sp. TaxID=239 RepID=UPI003529AF34
MILVTGGTGLVGSHLLVKLLQNNEQVKAIYRNKESLKAVKLVFEYYNALPLFDSIEWIKADINDIPSLETAFMGITKVYHCAAFISFDAKDKDKLHKVNIEGTANLVNCCIDFSVQKLCHVSSVAALGDATENEATITEETEWNPEVLHHDYAISKYAAEMEVWRGFQEGLQVVIVNPGVIFGYGFPDKGSSSVIQSLKKGNPFYTKGNFGMVAVEDVVAIMYQLMNSAISGERYTLVAENKTFQEVLNLIAGILKVKKPSIYANKVFTSFAWRLDWFLSKLLQKERKLTQASARAAHSTKQFDTTKVKNTLHYTFLDMTSYLKNLVPKI